MKKKLLLILSMVALLVCLLTIAVSATKIGDFEYNLDSSTMEAAFGVNQSYTGSVVYIPSTVEYNGETYTVTSLAKNALYNNDNVVTLYVPNTVTKLTENTFACCDGLTSVYIDTDELTYIGRCGMSYNDSDRDSKLGSNVISYYPTSEYGKENPQRTLHMKLENLTTLGAGALQGLNVDSLVLGGKLTTISKQLLRGSKFTSLTIKGEVTTIGEWLAPGCANLQTVVIESRSLETLDGSLFSGCTAITSFTIDLSNVTRVSGSAFRFSGSREKPAPGATQWYNLDGEKIVDLSSMENVGKEAFAGSNIGSAKIIWPTGIKVANFGHDSDTSAFRNAGITGMVYMDAADGYELFIDTWCFRNNSIETVVFGPNVTKVSGAFGGIKTLKTVVFLADSVDVTSSGLFSDCSGVNFYFKSLTTNTSFSQANEIVITSGSYSDYGACGFVANLVTADGNVTVGEAKHTTSDAINNALCPIGKVTETTCKYCDYSAYSVDGEAVEKKEHSYDFVGAIAYESYFALGFKTTKCECGAEKAAEEATEVALFIDYGYSCTEEAINGKYSVSQFFGVNKSAISAYIEATGKSFEYGFVVSSVNDPMSDENSSLIEQGKTYVTDSKFFAHDYVSVSVTGFTDGENGTVNNLDRQIAFCVFVKDGDRTVYLDNGETVDSVTMKSYNDVFAIKSNNND